jgi:shikimate 5-dehydrogenase
MLLHQAGHQVTLMTGKPAPVDQMREALNVELLARGLNTI